MARFNVVFNGEMTGILDGLAKRYGSRASALRHAIALYKWMSEERAIGSRFLVERNGELREVAFL